jgi:TPR repeat protein
MSSSTDELSQYAPRWAREGIAKQKQNPSLPPAPQLIMRPDDDDPPISGRAPFNGDVRAWRGNSAVAPIEQDEFDLVVTDNPSYRRRGFDERLFKTAAVASFTVIAMELMAFALFPNTVRDLFETHGPSWASSTPATTVAQQDYASAASQSDSRSIETASTEPTTEASSPVLARIATPAPPTAERTPQAPAATPGSTRTADRAPLSPAASAPPPSQPATVVVASAEPPAPPKPQQPDLSQSAQPRTVKLERYSATQSGPVQMSVSQPEISPVSQTPAVQTRAPQPVAVQTPAAQPPVVQTATVQTPASETPRVQAVAPQKTQPDRNFSSDEIDRMVSRGEAFLAQGDVSAARVVLVRAAEARDPRAALALGSTYDPTVLQRMGAVGIRPDPEKAHFWYERAAEFGSGEAGKRLTALAQLAR